MRTPLVFLFIGLTVIGYFHYVKHAEKVDQELVAASAPKVTTVQTKVPEVPVANDAPRIVKGTSAYKFVLFIPKGYGREARMWPMILFLHGKTNSEIQDNLEHFGPIRFGKDHPDDFPFIVLAPTTAVGWSASQVCALLDRVESQLMVDKDRVYVTGHSMGGHGTWMIACMYPGRFAAIAPNAGYGNPKEARKKLKHVPAWVFHGLRDDVVPVKEGMKMIGAMKDEGYEVKYTIYPQVDHNSTEIVYSDPELYKWFLQHKRDSREKDKTEKGEL